MPYPKLTISVFLLLQLIFAGYLLRGEVSYNFEVLFLLFVPMLGYLLYKQSDKAIHPRLLAWILIALAYCLSVYLASWAHAPLEHEGWGLVKITSLILCFFILALVLYYLRPGEDFFWYFLLSATVVLLARTFLELDEAGYKKILDGSRLGSKYSNPIKFGVYANALFILMLGGFSWAHRKGKLLLGAWIVFTLFNFVAVVLSQSRTAWISWPVALTGWGIYYYYYLAHRKLSLKLKLTIVSVASLLVITLLANDLVYQTFDKRIDDFIADTNEYISGKHPLNSMGSRYIMYEMAVLYIKKKPWLGRGIDDFSQHFKEESKRHLKEKYNLDHEGMHYSHLHNQFLVTWVIYGFFAFISLLALFSYLFVHFLMGIRRASMDAKPIWIAGLVFSIASFLSFMPGSPLQFSTYTAHYFLFITLLMVFSVLSLKRESEPPDDIHPSAKQQR